MADNSAAIAAALASPRAKFPGGGTNLVDLMRLEVETTDLLVDVSGLGPGRVETTAAGGLFIGVAVTNSELAAHAVVQSKYPLLARAVLSGASGQVRNLATVGGNLLQRTT